jgi:hypothetical protein
MHVPFVNDQLSPWARSPRGGATDSNDRIAGLSWAPNANYLRFRFYPPEVLPMLVPSPISRLREVASVPDGKCSDPLPLSSTPEAQRQLERKVRELVSSLPKSQAPRLDGCALRGHSSSRLLASNSAAQQHPN